MTGQDRADPSHVYVRRDPGVDPPSIEFALGVEGVMAEGDVALFVDDEASPSRMFELRRTGSAFRVCDLVTEPRGAFASAEAAIREGWAAVDADAARAAGSLPPLNALIGKPDPTGGAA